MPYINLIQEQRHGVQAKERKARSFFLLFIVALSVSGVAYGLLSMETLLVMRSASNVRTENEKNAPLVKQIDQNGKELADLTPRLKTLEDAQTITDRWDRILKHLVVQTPSTVWLTGLRCTSADPTKPIQLSFVGVTTSQTPVSDFTLRLQNLPDLDNVTFKYTNEKLISTTQGIEFEIDADLVGTAEQKVKTEATGDDKK